MTDNPKTMTAEERAENILGEICQYIPDGQEQERYFRSIRKCLEFEIQQAVDQARKESHSVCDHQGVCDACIEKYQKQGFEQAREMAAKAIEAERIGGLADIVQVEYAKSTRALQPPREGAE